MLHPIQRGQKKKPERVLPLLAPQPLKTHNSAQEEKFIYHLTTLEAFSAYVTLPFLLIPRTEESIKQSRFSPKYFIHQLISLLSRIIRFDTTRRRRLKTKTSYYNTIKVA